MSKKIFESKCKLLPQVELLFRKPELAQRAAATVENLRFENSRVCVSRVLFEDEGRRLIFQFDTSGARPTEILSFISAVVDAASITRPLLREIMIPIVQN